MIYLFVFYFFFFFSSHTLPLPSSLCLLLLCRRNINPFTSWKAVSLESCLSSYCETEELTGNDRYRCEKCGKLCDALKTLSIQTLPEVLCVHIKRFKHDSYLSTKITQPVQFPLESLDMRSYLSKTSTETSTHYDLSSVVTHLGGVNGMFEECKGELYIFFDLFIFIFIFLINLFQLFYYNRWTLYSLHKT